MRGRRCRRPFSGKARPRSLTCVCKTSQRRLEKVTPCESVRTQEFICKETTNNNFMNISRCSTIIVHLMKLWQKKSMESTALSMPKCCPTSLMLNPGLQHFVRIEIVIVMPRSYAALLWLNPKARGCEMVIKGMKLRRPQKNMSKHVGKGTSSSSRLLENHHPKLLRIFLPRKRPTLQCLLWIRFSFFAGNLMNHQTGE